MKRKNNLLYTKASFRLYCTIYELTDNSGVLKLLGRNDFPYAASEKAMGKWFAGPKGKDFTEHECWELARILKDYKKRTKYVSERGNQE